MSEIQRITGKSKARCAEGRANPMRRRDDGYVVDLIYLLEQSTGIIERLCEGKSVLSDDVLTIQRMNDIVAAIDDKNLSDFFKAKIAEGLGVKQPKEPIRISDD